MRQYLKHAAVLLGIIFILALVIRSINLSGNIFFYYDQARDAQRILDIVNLHQIKLLGPETDIQGVYNGSLFYYILAPVYLISSFNPNFAALFMIFINCLGIFAIYYCSKIIFNNKKIGIISALIWAISFEQINFAKFISNSSFMGISSIIFFSGLALYFLRKNKYGIPLSILGLALATQFNFYLIYLFIFYPIFWLIYRPVIKLKYFCINIVFTLLLFSPFILTDIKRHFLMVHSLISYMVGQSPSSNILSGIPLYIQRFKDAIYYTLFSYDTPLLPIILIIAIIVNYKLSKQKKSLSFLIIWLFSTFPLFLIGSGVIQRIQINTTIDAAVIILFALTINNLNQIKKIKYSAIIILFLIMASNIILLVKDNSHATNPIAYEPVLLKEEKQIIDYTYKIANNKPFSICAVTNPLFVNTTWSFLYGTYGKNRYGYLPFWSGQPQDINQSLIPYDSMHVQQRFLIIEPSNNISSLIKKATIYDEDHISRLAATNNFGPFIVQNRELQYAHPFYIDTQQLTTLEKNTINLEIAKDPRYSCYTNY